MDYDAIWIKECSNDILMSCEYGFSRLSWGLHEVVFFMTLVCSMTSRHIWINYSCVLTNVKNSTSPLIWISACSWCALGSSPNNLFPKRANY